MNCISRINLRVVLFCLASCVACDAKEAVPEIPVDPLTYRLDYRISASPVAGSVDVELTVSQHKALLRAMTMRLNSRIDDIDGDGSLDINDTEAVWIPPAEGGVLRWRATVSHRRNGDGYDAWLGPDWGLFRAEDIIPRAATRSLRNAKSETWMTFELPHGWSAVSQYFSRDGLSRVDNPSRRFDQPSGWIVVGKLGVRRDNIAGMRVAVAGPEDNAVRRLDTLALLNWTLPELARILPELPPRLTVVSAGDPMWRGGLSAPASMYIHADRPLISENATSTLLHEIMHIALGLDSADNYDWIVEGLAEFYSLQLLHRSGTISTTRYESANESLADWANSTESLCQKSSTGAATAYAVGVFAQVDAYIREITAGDASLDDVTRELQQGGEDVDLDVLTDTVEKISGRKPDLLNIENLPGCRTIDNNNQQARTH